MPRLVWPNWRWMWRSTNLLERSLGEVKRRTKVIGPFPGETSCLTVVWAVLDLYITHGTNGVGFTQLERQRLKRIKYEGHVSRAGPPRASPQWRGPCGAQNAAGGQPITPPR